MDADRDDPGQLPDAVREFVVKEIDSVAELEGLLLVRAAATTAWDVATLARRLYVDDATATRVTTALCDRRFLERDSAGNVRYAASAELDGRVAEVAAAYRRFLIPITHLIHNKARSSVQQFADAFRLREKKP